MVSRRRTRSRSGSRGVAGNNRSSDLEAELLLHLTCVLSDEKWVREYRFHVERKWRFDFAELETFVAVEVEGLSKHKSRHTSWTGFRNDCEKYNAAAIMGWCVLRFTDVEIFSGEAISTIEEAIQWRKSNLLTREILNDAARIHDLTDSRTTSPSSAPDTPN